MDERSLDIMSEESHGEESPEWVANIARATPVRSVTAFRVVVIEGDGRQGVTEFHVLEDALQYADDVASESDAPWPIAYVFTPGLQFVRRGRPYYAGRHAEQDGSDQARG
jgi:hypothetical protein